jgi:hypothetical protein
MTYRTSLPNGKQPGAEGSILTSRDDEKLAPQRGNIGPEFVRAFSLQGGLQGGVAPTKVVRFNNLILAQDVDVGVHNLLHGLDRHRRGNGGPCAAAPTTTLQC